MSDEAQVPTPRNKGGRPRSPASKTTISTWIPVSVHDQLIQLANRRGESVSHVVRMMVARGLMSDRKGQP